jgi:hypothetical protein
MQRHRILLVHKDQPDLKVKQVQMELMERTDKMVRKDLRVYKVFKVKLVRKDQQVPMDLMERTDKKVHKDLRVFKVKLDHKDPQD